jgi:hypothetical protein
MQEKIDYDWTSYVIERKQFDTWIHCDQVLERVKILWTTMYYATRELGGNGCQSNIFFKAEVRIPSTWKS